MNLFCNEHCSIYSRGISTHQLIFPKHKLKRATCPVPHFLSCTNQAVLPKALRGPEMQKVQHDTTLALIRQLKKWDFKNNPWPAFSHPKTEVNFTSFKLHRAGFKAGTHLCAPEIRWHLLCAMRANAKALCIEWAALYLGNVDFQ